MINLDDPRHLRLRSIVNRAFTPKMVARIEENVHIRARRLVDEMVADHPDGRADLVQALSGPLPLQIICDMMGIPEEDEPQGLPLDHHHARRRRRRGRTRLRQVVAAVLEMADYATDSPSRDEPTPPTT